MLFDDVLRGTRQRRRSALTATAMLGAIMVGCGGEAPQEEVIARPVKMVEIGFGGASGVREYPGTIEASERAELAFEVPGLIVEMPVVQGQWVRRGALLARLDARNYEAQRDADAASLEAARADFQRYQELYAADAVTLQDLQLRQAQFEVAEARFRASHKSLDDTRLLAPFAGRVARTFVDAYQNVLAKETVLLLNDDRQLEIVIAIPEADALAARRVLDDAGWLPGTIEAEATVSTFTDRRFPAQLAEFATQADPVTRTFEAAFAFEAPTDILLVPGMTARMVVRRTGAPGEAGVQRLPAGAVFGADDGQPSVWKVNAQTMTVTRAPVQVGSLFGDEIEVVGGLADGDLVAVTGVANLREGDPVRRMQD
jgi:RND family efflux transporter MFP subunit